MKPRWHQSSRKNFQFFFLLVGMSLTVACTALYIGFSEQSKMASDKFSSKVDILDWAWSEVEYMFSGCPNGPKRHPKSLVSMGLCGRQMSIKCLFSAWFGRILPIISTPALWIKQFWSTHVDQTFAKSQTISKLILSLFTTTTHASKRLKWLETSKNTLF